MEQLPYPWNNLTVELAVKIYEFLHGEDPDGGVLYEFTPEAKDILSWYIDQGKGSEIHQLEVCINQVLSSSLNHKFEVDSFTSLAEFVESRVKMLTHMGQLYS